jgi:hypothetical protein
MSHRDAKFEYPKSDITLVLRNSYIEDEYYGVDNYESKRLKIVLTKYGCRHSFHTLPGHVTAELYPFVWNKLNQCFRIHMKQKVTVHLNALEEAIVNYPIFEES